MRFSCRKIEKNKKRLRIGSQPIDQMVITPFLFENWIFLTAHTIEN